MARKKPDHISQKDWDAVEVPELTGKEMTRMRPAAEIVPGLVDEYKATRGAQKAPVKKPVTIRLSEEVVTHFKSTGRGWQTRVDNLLKAHVARSAKSEGPQTVKRKASRKRTG